MPFFKVKINVINQVTEQSTTGDDGFLGWS
jgi:hypothetical protein